MTYRDADGKVSITSLPSDKHGRAASNDVNIKNKRDKNSSNEHQQNESVEQETGPASLDDAVDATLSSSGVETQGVGKAAGGRGLEFAGERLQEYVILCSQQSDGGLRDKPGK